jgi:hypothetical protein
MRRALLTVVLAAAALPAAAGAAPPPASVQLVSCSIAQHEAAFKGRMKQLPGASRMAMRFTLLEESGRSGARRVEAPALRRWRSSKPAVGVFAYRQGFRNLPENASHRVRVDFRWYAEDGTELARARKRSARCRQYVALPNLVARITRAGPSKVAGVMRYEALVKNVGKAAATLVPVELTVDGTVVDTRTFASLAPGERRTFVIRGPECDRLATLEADPEQVIAESSDADNAYEFDCAALRKLA